MANNNRKFVVSLEIDSKTAEQQIKTSSKNIEKILANIGNASDKITYFKGLVDEISNVDKQLADFKAKYGEKMFAEMFGTFGTDIENKLQSTIGMTKQQLSMLDDLYGKKNKLQQTLDALDNKPIKIDTTQDNDVKIISELIEQYRIATKEWASSNPNSTTDEINKLIAERTRLASLLANTSDYVIEYGSDDAAELITLNDKVITEAQDFLKDFYINSQNTANEIRQVSKDLVNNIDADISKVMTNPKAQSNVYDELYKKTKKYLDLQKQLGDENISDEDYNKAFDDVSTIENEIAVLGELKGKAEEVKNIFARFNNSEIADDNLLDELIKTLGIEIPQSVQKTEGSFNQVGKQVIEATEYVKGLEAAIRNMFDAASKQSEIEYKILINGQDIDARNGSVDTISLKTSAEAYLANLTKDVDVDAHSHQGKSANINTYDLSSAINKYYSGLTKMSAIISDKDILTLDLTKVKAEDAFKALTKVKEVVGQSKLGTIKPEQLNNIFSNINSSYTDIVKKWEPTKFSELAQYIYDIKQNSEQVSTPLERFKNLLMSITDGKIDFSKYTKQLNNFSTDNVEKLFNEIMKLENITEDGKLLQIDDKVIQGSIENITKDIQRQKDEYLQLRQTAKLTYEDIRAEIDKYMSTGDRSFFDKYYHKSDDMRLADDFTELADSNLDINSLTNKIAVDFGIEPREIQSVEQVSDAYKDLKSSLPNADDFKNTFTPDDDQIRKVRELADEYRIIMSLLSKDTQENNFDNYTYNALQERAKAINDVIQKVRPNDASMDFISDYYGASPETTRAVKDWRTADKVRMGHYNESIITDESRQRAIDLINQQKQAHKENVAAIKEEIVAKSNLNNIDYDDAAADIARENGQLEEKLELLREIADQYGVNITNANRARYEELNQKDMNDGLTSREEDRFSELGDKIIEADNNLEEFGATYDKITLKLANGKTKDIFPDDKGLRDLYKYTDSPAYDEFNGKEIEDVIFTRKQEQASESSVGDNSQIERATKKLQEFYDLTNKLDDKKLSLPDEELGKYQGKLEAAKQDLEDFAEQGKISADEMEKVSKAYDQAARRMQDALHDNEIRREAIDSYYADISDRSFALESENEDLREQLDAKKNMVSDENIGDNTSSEMQQLEKLDAKLKEVKTTIESKTQAFKEESDVVDSGVGSEIQQIEKLDTKLKEVKAAIESKTQAFRDESSVVNEVVSKETIALDTLSTYLDTIHVAINNIIDGLNRINNTKLNDVQDKELQVVTDRDNTTNSNIQDTINKYALDSTLSTTNSILQSILTAVNSSESTNQVVEALNGAIADLKAVADAPKTSDNVKQKVKDDTKDKIKDTSTDSKKEPTFDDIKNDEVSNFEQYRKEVESSIYITDEFKDRLSKLGSELNNIGDAKGLDAWKQSIGAFKDEFSRYEDANKKVLTGQINTIKKEAKDAMKGLDLDIPTNDTEKRAKQEEIAQGFKEIQIASDICANKIKNNQDVEINALNATKMQLLENINAYKKEYGLLNSGGKSGKNYGNTAIIRETTRYNQFQQYANDAEAGFKDSSTFNNKLQEYINAYNKLIAKREELATKTVLTDRDVQEFNDAKQAAANYGKELEKMITKSQKLASNSFQMGIIGSDIDVDDALSRKQALTDFVTQMHDANESTIKFSNNYQECMFKMKNSDGTWTRMTAVLDKTSNKMYSTAGEVTKYGTAIGEFIGALKGEFLKLGRYMIASFGFEEVVQAFRTGITYVKEIDDALTELKKVTNETDAGYERFLQTMSKTAGVVGSTVAELTTMAAEWARLGYSMQQAASLAESTAILLNVSEFEDATQASEALISTIQANINA